MWESFLNSRKKICNAERSFLVHFTKNQLETLQEWGIKQIYCQLSTQILKRAIWFYKNRLVCSDSNSVTHVGSRWVVMQSWYHHKQVKINSNYVSIVQSQFFHQSNKISKITTSTRAGMSIIHWLNIINTGLQGFQGCKYKLIKVDFMGIKHLFQNPITIQLEITS